MACFHPIKFVSKTRRPPCSSLDDVGESAANRQIRAETVELIMFHVRLFHETETAPNRRKLPMELGPVRDGLDRIRTQHRLRATDQDHFSE